MVCIEIQRSASMIVVCVCGLGEVWVSVEGYVFCCDNLYNGFPFLIFLYFLIQSV